MSHLPSRNFAREVIEDAADSVRSFDHGIQIDPDVLDILVQRYRDEASYLDDVDGRAKLKRIVEDILTRSARGTERSSLVGQDELGGELFRVVDDEAMESFALPWPFDSAMGAAAEPVMQERSGDASAAPSTEPPTEGGNSADSAHGR